VAVAVAQEALAHSPFYQPRQAVRVAVDTTNSPERSKRAVQVHRGKVSQVVLERALPPKVLLVVVAQVVWVLTVRRLAVAQAVAARRPRSLALL
jgi:hypothetical protein